MAAESKRARHKETHGSRIRGYGLRDIILGGQDGLVNVLGVVLAVATATQDARIVIIAGLAATFAESISMAAVGYTSSKAAEDYYRSELEKERREIKEVPDTERREIRDIYYSKGFRGPLLAQIVRKITSNKKLWLRTMMEEELRLFPEEDTNPSKDAAIIGVSAVIGSLIPLAPFMFMPVAAAVITSLAVSTLVLFVTGAVKAKLTIGSWVRSGLEIAVIGMAAALIGYAIGAFLGVAFYAV